MWGTSLGSPIFGNSQNQCVVLLENPEGTTVLLKSHDNTYQSRNTQSLPHGKTVANLNPKP